MNVIVTETPEECMNNCTETGRNGGACVAMVWGIDDKKCWLLYNTMTIENLVYDNITHTAFVSDLSLFENRHASCANGDKFTPNNLTFDVFCGRDVGDDITPWIGVNGTTEHHSDSLDDCMQYCSTMQSKTKSIRQGHLLDGKPRWRSRSELDANFTERKELSAQQHLSAELPGSDGRWSGS